MLLEKDQYFNFWDVSHVGAYDEEVGTYYLFLFQLCTYSTTVGPQLTPMNPYCQVVSISHSALLSWYPYPYQPNSVFQNS